MEREKTQLVTILLTKTGYSMRDPFILGYDYLFIYSCILGNTFDQFVEIIHGYARRNTPGISVGSFWLYYKAE